MLLSLDPPNITNGTRFTVYKINPNIIEVALLNGPSAGKRALIPRIPLKPSETDSPFQFRRLQILLRQCFVMTINKSQGQSFNTIGLITCLFARHVLHWCVECMIKKQTARVRSRFKIFSKLFYSSPRRRPDENHQFIDVCDRVLFLS